MKKIEKKVIEECRKQWFAPNKETTVMNWDGLFRDDIGILNHLFGNVSYGWEKAELLKKSLWDILIEPWLKDAYRIK